MPSIAYPAGNLQNCPEDIDFKYPVDIIAAMLLNLWLSQKRGRAAALAAYLKVPASFVANMASGSKPIPIAHGAPIETFTGGHVTRREMFPNNWQIHWPELVDLPFAAVSPTDAPQALLFSEQLRA